MPPNARAPFFEGRAERYESMIDWPKRLANETPFYERLFERVGVRRLLDVACGTGHHAALFHSWGLTVEGADASEDMLARCRSNHGQSETLGWVRRLFDEPHPEGGFDVVICVGNSLAIAEDLPHARRVVACMLGALRSGGVCVIQVLNLWRFPEGPTSWQKCVRLPDKNVPRVLLKGIHRVGARGYIDVVELTLTDDGVEREEHFDVLLGFEAEALSDAARAAGGADIQCHGDYHDAPYDRSVSTDLILECRRK